MNIKENKCDGDYFCNCNDKTKYSELFEDEDSIWVDEGEDKDLLGVIQDIIRNNKAMY